MSFPPTASLLRRRRGQAQSASGSCAVTTAHLFQAPNVIRSPVAALARFYLAPAHLYQPRKSFKAPQRSYFTIFLLLLNFFSLRTIVAASKQRQFASVSPPLNLLRLVMEALAIKKTENIQPMFF
ncbi:hypothetical protein PF002_g29337 [Phytophthora fragariae]|uniref:Uncharacterized protein n=1 Tax=Phytophthora fragariae TaxID=53985 RepID=A0A6A3VZ77_9STRA|nr:hypothetical protein PF002_g29337 [Phytophthora fragariae]